MKRPSKRTNFRIGLLLAAVTALPLGAPLLATTYTWSNTGTNFNDPASWGGAGFPSTTADTATFATAETTNPVLSASDSISELNFSTTASSGYTISASGNYILSLFASGGNSAQAIIGANTSGTNTLDASLTLNLGLGGGTQTFTQAAGGTLVVNSMITANSATTALLLTGGGTFTLNGANTFGGGVGLLNATAPTVNLGNAAALGTGTLTVLNGKLDNTTSADLTVANTLSLTGGTLTYIGGTHNLTFNGTGNTVAGSAVASVTANTLTISNAISGSGGLQKAGAGTLVLSGNNTFTGAITTNGTTAGTLTLNGSNTMSSITLQGGAILNINNANAIGSGTLTSNGGTVDSTVAGGTTLATNNPITLANFLTFVGTNNLTFGTGTVTETHASPNTITLNGNSVLTFGGALVNGITGTTNNGFILAVNKGTSATSSLSLGGFTLAPSGDTAAITAGFNGSGPVTLTGPITNGDGSANVFSYTGTGSVTITGASNTYSGGFNLSGGSANLNNASALGGNVTNGTTGAYAPFTITGGTIANTTAAAITYGPNPVALNGNLGYGAATGTSSSMEFGGAVSSAASRTITMNGAGALTFDGGFVNTAAGAITLTSTLGTATSATSVLNLGGFTLATNSAATVTSTITGTGNVNITGAVIDGGTTGTIFPNLLSYTGSGALTLSGANTFSGGLANNSTGTGVINLNSSGALGNGGTFTWSSGTIDNTSGAAVTLGNNPSSLINTNAIVFSTPAGTAANNLTFGNGVVSVGAAKTITLNGGGALTFGGVLTNTYTNGGQIETVNNGTGTTANSVLSFGGFQLTPTASTVVTTDTFKGSGTVNFTGPVTDGGKAGTLAYQGTGTLLINGVNTNTGGVTVNTGTGTLGGAGTVSGLLALASGTFVSPGTTTASGVTGTLTGTGAVNLLGTYIVDLGSTASSKDLVAATGALTLSSTTSILTVRSLDAGVANGTVYEILTSNASPISTTFNGLANNSTYTDAAGDMFTVKYNDLTNGTVLGDVSLTFNGGTPVPEPSTYVSGLLMLIALGWKFRRSLRRGLGSAV